jgi:hypothetical protein
MYEKIGVGRFPIPDKWVLRQLPEELHGMFGPHGDPDVGPDHDGDDIYYTYSVGLPDGNAMKKALIAHYAGSGTPVTFTVGDEIELEGLRFTVQSWSRETVPARGDGLEYAIHEVGVKLADQ